MINHPIKPILNTLPTLPGCYLYKDSEGKVLYVGKAKNIRKRVTSYFANYKKLTARLQLLIDNAIDVEIHCVNTEIEALILEASLIKKYLPKYNVMLKDDKSYSYIKITKDPYPIIYRARDTNDKNAIYFGPFPNGLARDSVLNFLRKEFPFRSCSYHITDQELEERKTKKAEGKYVRSRICTYYHIGRCGAPCEGLISQDDYLSNISNIKKFLQNRKKSLVVQLESKMKWYAKEQEFEKAAKIKEHIDALNYVTQKTVISYGDDEDDVMGLLFQKTQKGLEKLIKTLGICDLNKMSKTEKADYLGKFRMECFDISNIQGSNPVGSMVVFEGGLPLKSHYRKFKINVKDSPDDFAMMTEMLTRRLRYISPKTLKFKRRDKREEIKDPNSIKEQVGENSSLEFAKFVDLKNDPSFNSVPDLIIIDGGKGQLKQGINVMHDLKFEFDDNGKTPRYWIREIKDKRESASSADILERKEKKQEEVIEKGELLELVASLEGNVSLGVKNIESGMNDLEDVGEQKSIVICGLAKRREEIFLPYQKNSYLFDDQLESLFLLQRIRDEAHRFGITYHRLRRSKSMFE